eukprot:8565-Heterococcus_DN1.PRE.3
MIPQDMLFTTCTMCQCLGYTHDTSVNTYLCATRMRFMPTGASVVITSPRLFRQFMFTLQGQHDEGSGD